MSIESRSPVTLKNCADEPIRVPGKIQPHGALLVVASDLRVQYASLNLLDIVGKDARASVGQPLESLFAKDVYDVLRRQLTAGHSENANPGKIRIGDASLDVIVHTSGDSKLIEFERSKSAEEMSFINVYRRINSTIEAIGLAPDLHSMFDVTVSEVKRLTNYDRIMIYRFDEEWNGKVIAEAKESHLDPFLGLQYPASDIPPQARALYHTNWLRMIPNVAYEPSPLYPPANGLDLSQSVLRSVSPIHLQYLKNMGVVASMSISIIREGKLWGLIACHDSHPNYLPYEVRQGLEFIGKYFSAQLGAKERTENLDYKIFLKDKQSTLHKQMLESENFLEGLHQGSATLLDLVEGCTGAALYFYGKTKLVGQTPDETQVESIVNWLRPRCKGASAFSTTQLSKHLPSAIQFSDIASGVLAVSIPEPEPAFVIWFKPEVIQTVSWGGNPNKPDMNDPLTPRRSFQLWQETVKATSLPWPQEEISVVEELRRSIIEVDLARQVTAAVESNKELDMFAHLVAHDLKEPLRNIQFFAEFIAKDTAATLDAESKRNLNDIQTLVQWAKIFISELYEFSKLNKVDLSFSVVDLNQVLEDVKSRLKSLLEQNQVELKIPQAFPAVRCDRVRIGQLFINLISNAIKYNDNQKKIIEIGVDNQLPQPVFYVRDNGIGISEKDYDRVFKIFERLHERDQYGGGTGSGLAIAQRIVQRHAGQIWVESAPGRGSTFFFTLQP